MQLQQEMGCAHARAATAAQRAADTTRQDAQVAQQVVELRATLWRQQLEEPARHYALAGAAGAGAAAGGGAGAGAGLVLVLVLMLHIGHNAIRMPAAHAYWLAAVWHGLAAWLAGCRVGKRCGLCCGCALQGMCRCVK